MDGIVQYIPFRHVVVANTWKRGYLNCEQQRGTEGPVGGSVFRICPFLSSVTASPPVLAIDTLVSDPEGTTEHEHRSEYILPPELRRCITTTDHAYVFIARLIPHNRHVWIYF